MSRSLDFTITADSLLKGLRPSKRAPRDNSYLTVCKGATGREGSLAALSPLTAFDTSSLTGEFPFPQIFSFANVTIVCDETKIYEFDGSSLTLKIDVGSVCGGLWEAVDFYEYIYMSNQEFAVVRDALTGVYSVVDAPPVARAMCNYNGQVLISPSSVRYEYYPGDGWTELGGPLPAPYTGTDYISYEGDIYGANYGKLYKWNSTTSSWEQVCGQVGTSSCYYNHYLFIHDGRLYNVSKNVAFINLITSWALGETGWTLHFEGNPTISIPLLDPTTLNPGDPNPAVEIQLSPGNMQGISYDGDIIFGTSSGQGRLLRWNDGSSFALLGTVDYLAVGTSKPMYPFVCGGSLQVICGYLGGVWRYTGGVALWINDTDTIELMSNLPETSLGSSLASHGDIRPEFLGATMYAFLYQSAATKWYLCAYNNSKWTVSEAYEIDVYNAYCGSYAGKLHTIEHFGRLHIYDLTKDEKTFITGNFPDGSSGEKGSAVRTFEHDGNLIVATDAGYIFSYTAAGACVE